LQTSFNQLLQRHEVLRCGFKQLNGEITCSLEPSCTVVPMTVHQVSCSFAHNKLNLQVF
jgi:hypothetical protein